MVEYPRLTNDEIVANALNYFATDSMSDHEAMASELIPFTFHSFCQTGKKLEECAIRMFVSKYIGLLMQNEAICSVEVANRLSVDSYWKGLCLLAQANKDKSGQIPSDWWVKTQAPLYADGASILKPWPELQKDPHHRFALAGLIARMVSVGIVDNQLATDRLTKVSRPTQLAIIKKTIPLIDTELADRTELNKFIRQEVGKFISI